jgi:8-oxo-dGTP pyrophosphatase MutT (NUDIX family)
MSEFTQQEQNDFYNQQPAKRIGAAAWLEDVDGRLLIARPSYKKGWTLIGGIVDLNESPLDAVIRETFEEVSLRLTKERFQLAGYRYVEARDGRGEDTQVYFKAQLTPLEVAGVHLEVDGELSEYRFVSLSELPDYADTPRMQAVVAAANGPEIPFYIVNETRVI